MYGLQGNLTRWEKVSPVHGFLAVKFDKNMAKMTSMKTDENMANLIFAIFFMAISCLSYFRHASSG